MTLPSSFPLSMSQIAAELGQSLPKSLRDSDVRSLAGTGSGPISFSDLLGKSTLSVTEVHVTSLGSASTSHSFSSVNFGAAFSGRWIAAIIYQFSKGSFETVSAISSVSIGGTSASGNDTGAHGGTGNTLLVGAGIFRAQPSGTSGTISFNTGATTRCQVVVLSIAGYNMTSQHHRQFNTNTSATGASVNINIPSNGLLIAAGAKANGNAVSWTGVTEQGDVSPLAGYRRSHGYNVQMSSETGRTVTFTSSGSALTCLEAQSFVAA